MVPRWQLTPLSFPSSPLVEASLRPQSPCELTWQRTMPHRSLPVSSGSKGSTPPSPGSPHAQVGIFERKPRAVADVVRRWLTVESDQLAAMAARCKALGQPHALFNIVSSLSEMVVP